MAASRQPPPGARTNPHTWLIALSTERLQPAGFAAELGQKDVRLVLAAAEKLQTPLPIASLLRDRFLTLLAIGGASLDWSAVGALPAWEAGGPSPTARD